MEICIIKDYNINTLTYQAVFYNEDRLVTLLKIKESVSAESIIKNNLIQNKAVSLDGGDRFRFYENHITIIPIPTTTHELTQSEAQ